MPAAKKAGKKRARKTAKKKIVKKKTARKVKKVAKKKPKAVKKKVNLKKRAIRKKIKRKNTTIKNAPAAKYFILCNGQKLKSIKELANIIQDIEDHVFGYHVNQDKNDFATWIAEVFEDIKLAKKLTGIRNKEKMKLVLVKHIKH